MSSSQQDSSPKNMGERELLEFFQNRFDEIFRKDDKYRAKIEKHLKELVADRYELEAEVLRRGEKISDLQRAVVDLQLSCFEEKERYLKVFAENEQLKRNEDKLHENIRELLNVTKDKDLRDRIIYVLKDPSVDVCFREKNFGSSTSFSRNSSEEFLVQQIQALQEKLHEHSNISRSKSDIILEDCKQTLEKSRDRITSNEIEFRKLQNKLHQTEAELRETKQTCLNLRDIIQKLEIDHDLPKLNLSNLLQNTKYNYASSPADQPYNPPPDRFQSNLFTDPHRKSKYSNQPNQPPDQQLGMYDSSSLRKTTSNNASIQVNQTNDQQPDRYQSNLFTDPHGKSKYNNLPNQPPDQQLGMYDSSSLKKTTSNNASIQVSQTNDQQLDRYQSKNLLRITNNEVANSQDQQTNLFKNLLRKSKIDDVTSLPSENMPSTSVKKSSSQIQNPLLPSSSLDNKLSKSSKTLVSNASDMHLSLVMLSKIINKLLSILNNIQSTEAFVETAKLPQAKATGSKYVSETDVTQLQNYIRQCTRLTFDIKNLWKHLKKDIGGAKDRTMFQGLESDLTELESAVDELAVTTTEVDLLSIGISRATFFSYLTGPKQSFEKFGVKDRHNHSKYVSDIKKMEANLKAAKNFNIKAVQIMEKIIQKCSMSSPERGKPSESNMNNWGTSTDNTKYPFQVASSSKETDRDELRKITPGERSLMTDDFVKVSFNPSNKQTFKSQSASTDKLLGSLKVASSSKETECDELRKITHGDRSVMADDFVKASFESSNKQTGKSQSTSNDNLCEGITRQNMHFEEKSAMNENFPRSNSEYGKSQGRSTHRLLDSFKVASSTKGTTDCEDITRKNTQFEENSERIEYFPKVPFGNSMDEADRIVSNDYLKTADVTRNINKTLAKISVLEKGEHFKDDEFCKHFGEQINMLMEKLKTLYDEFNVKSLHEQFAEYSSVTFNKLETLAKQSRDAVISAEAQITAQRTNAKHLSNKLRNTEDLLRESIDECLLLKQKLQVLEIRNETEKLKFRDKLQERLSLVQDFDELETAVEEVASSLQPSKEAKKPSGPYECLYCKQGAGHKQCEEKIKELRTSNRKLATENKLLQQEIKEEKKLCRMTDDQKNKIVKESSIQIESLKESVQTLEARNVSLMEQLKLDKNRLKKMERFRHLEIEGFQTDVKNLKSKIQDLEKQLGKAVSLFGTERKDMEFLESIHNTTEHSKQAASAIRRLKAKLYELERDFKHL